MPQTLISVPPALARFLHSTRGGGLWRSRFSELCPGGAFIGADPRSLRLGSGGGTVHLLHQAWRAVPRAGRPALSEWLAGGQRLVLHAGGESRRLPAYAGIGKAFLPLPPVGGPSAWRFDQRLMDLQLPGYRRVLKEAGPRSAVLVTSGDVWLDFNPLEIPAVDGDIVGVGMRVSAEVARHFGVYFVGKGAPRGGSGEQAIAFFRQKPSAAEINQQLERFDFLVDTGMWLMSAAAVQLLFRRCGWDDRRQGFATRDGLPGPFDLYTEMGSALGRATPAPLRLRRLGWNRLRTAVIPLSARQARFHHLGSSRQLFESIDQIQQGRYGPDRLLSSASNRACVAPESFLPVWLDGVALREPVVLGGLNVLTGLPAGARLERLAANVCVDAVPVGKEGYLLRPYHLDDTLRGDPGGGATICGRDARAWLAARGMAAMRGDVFDLRIYPILPAGRIDQQTLDWFFSNRPDPVVGSRLARTRRLSAAQIADATHLGRLFDERNRGYEDALQGAFEACLREGDSRLFDEDLSALADFCVRRSPRLRRWILRNRRRLLDRISRAGNRSKLLLLLSRISGNPERSAYRAKAYRLLQASIASPDTLSRLRPRRALKEDQIVWGRSPVRLDLAGGWTDTPPYCLDHGGAVLNAAVLLNGQPPIQVFIRPVPERRFRLRSIDLGSTEDVSTYDALSGFRDPTSGFSLAKAALALAGFHPDFLAGKPFGSLRGQLAAFGGGLEISLLSAVPKGSGLGTSSILGATLLGALDRACGLGWGTVDIYNRVLGVEQLLTTGGGWQDQAGALFRSIKLIQTQPGSEQTPTVRYLPENLFGAAYANRSLLLYYTGVTRLAKNILNEIVGDMFLGRTSTMRTLAFIRANALALDHAVQEGSPAALNRCISRSWDLNREMDPATTTPAIARIIATCGSDLAACKLLGAGGGGYILLCARDPESGERIRERLEFSPPNPRARFIAFQVADQGLEVTVS